MYKERISTHQAIGFGLAVIGFGVFYKDQIDQFLGSPESYNMGISLVVGAALAWVVFASLQKALVQKFHAQGLNLLIYLVPVITLLPWADFEVMASFSLIMWAFMIFLGLNTLLAYGAIAEAFRFLPANKVGIIVTLNPLITLITMSLLTTFGVNWIEPERISVYGFLGAGLILLGVVTAVVVQGKTNTNLFNVFKWKVGLKR